MQAALPLHRGELECEWAGMIRKAWPRVDVTANKDGSIDVPARQWPGSTSTKPALHIPNGGYTVSLPKNARKGRPWCLRISLRTKTAGVTKLILDPGSEYERGKWLAVLSSSRPQEPVVLGHSLLELPNGPATRQDYLPPDWQSDTALREELDEADDLDTAFMRTTVSSHGDVGRSDLHATVENVPAPTPVPAAAAAPAPAPAPGGDEKAPAEKEDSDDEAAEPESNPPPSGKETAVAGWDFSPVTRAGELLTALREELDEADDLDTAFMRTTVSSHGDVGRSDLHATVENVPAPTPVPAAAAAPAPAPAPGGDEKAPAEKEDSDDEAAEPESTPPPSGKETAVAGWDFSPVTRAGELLATQVALRKGDVVEVLDKARGDWWLVRAHASAHERARARS
eukprot:COSAG01_NODE_9280_length_2495_cov_482.247078_1_plen_398_part_00